MEQLAPRSEWFNLALKKVEAPGSAAYYSGLQASLRKSF